MTGNEYQVLAARTIANMGTALKHSLLGMAAEVGELHSIYQKVYQGHPFEPEHAKKEVGDIMWMLAEYCTAMGFELDDVMATNINKLRERYPEGFEQERSLHRREGDI